MLKEELENIKKAATANFNNFGHITPVFISEMKGEKIIMPLFWNGPEDKDAFASMLQSWIANGEVTEYIMVSEAWVVKQLKEMSNAREWLKEEGSLQNHPERTEAILIQYASHKEEIDLMSDIIRDGDDASLSEWIYNHRNNDIMETFGSRFVGMFSKSSASLN